MTNEQAIMVLECVDAYGLADEAKQMAIEALKADRCYLGSPCEYQNPEVKIPQIAVEDTCKNIGEEYAECDQFVCGACGIELQDWHRVERDMDDGEVSYHEYTFRFCPNCGRRIVEGADNGRKD